MTATIVLTIVFFVVGALAAALWTIALRLLVQPCISLCELGDRWDMPLLSIAAFVLAAGLQGYAALAFVAFVIGWLRSFLAARHDLLGAPFWVVAYFVAMVPAFNLVKSACQAEKKTPMHIIPLVVVPVVMVSFFVFVLRPPIMEAVWGWMPYVRR